MTSTATILASLNVVNLETAEQRAASIDKAMTDFGIAEGNGEKALTDKAEFLFDHSSHFQGENGARRAYDLYANGKVSVRPKSIDLNNKDTMANGASKFGRFIALGQANVAERKQLFAWFNEMDDAGIVTGSRYETLLSVARRQLDKPEVTLSRDEVEAIITGRAKAKAEIAKSGPAKAEAPKVEAPKADAPEAPKADAPEAPKADAPEAPKADAPSAPEAPKADTRGDELDFIANIGAAFRAYADRFPNGSADPMFAPAQAAWDAFMASRLAAL